MDSLLHPLSTVTPASTQPRLLDRFRQVAHERGDSVPTIKALVGWARRFILFHDKRHPDTLDRGHVAHFLEHVVQTEKEPLPALAMARAALDLLYREVLGIDLGELPQPRPPRILDQLRQILRLRHYSPRTEESYANWARRFFRFHQLRRVWQKIREGRAGPPRRAAPTDPSAVGAALRGGPLPVPWPHRLRHPRRMGAAEVEQFPTHLAVEGNISASSQNQALNALAFLYAQVSVR